MKKVRSYILAVLFAISVGGATTTLIAPSPVARAACADHMLTFPAWFRGINGACDGKITDDPKQVVLKVALNIVEIILQLVAYAAVGFIIYGGFLYVIGAGASDKITAAKNSIINAVVGLVISMLSIGIVNIVMGNLTKSGSTDAKTGLFGASAGDIINGVLTTVYWAGGVSAIIVIVVAGIMYATSGGDAGAVKRAKDAILYAVIGLVVIALAFVITNVVVGRIA